ncbi:MAG TPA: hypothetical protein DCP31_29560 [Cyanobacteria bacterium UBA8543]|nr:hypothetical protein [Cyanobacteria bacterium UBA8543]
MRLLPRDPNPVKELRQANSDSRKNFEFSVIIRHTKTIFRNTTLLKDKCNADTKLLAKDS